MEKVVPILHVPSGTWQNFQTLLHWECDLWWHYKTRVIAQNPYPSLTKTMLLPTSKYKSQIYSAQLKKENKKERKRSTTAEPLCSCTEEANHEGGLEGLQRPPGSCSPTQPWLPTASRLLPSHQEAVFPQPAPVYSPLPLTLILTRASKQPSHTGITFAL